MGIDAAHYHRWSGALGRGVVGTWRGTAAVVRTTLLQVLRRKAYWVIYAVGISQFLVYWAVIYALTQMQIPPEMQNGMLRTFGFSPDAADPQDTGYLDFMEQQSFVVMILLAFCGSLSSAAISATACCRFISRAASIVGIIIAGKLSAIVESCGCLPCSRRCCCFLSSACSRHRSITGAKIGASCRRSWVMDQYSARCWPCGWPRPAYLQKLAPIAVVWSSLFVLLGRLASSSRSTGDARVDTSRSVERSSSEPADSFSAVPHTERSRTEHTAVGSRRLTAVALSRCSKSARRRGG
ncbi:MAG: hypothetical protein QM775_34660 [Pirellulales bacterium]